MIEPAKFIHRVAVASCAALWFSIAGATIPANAAKLLDVPVPMDSGVMGRNELNNVPCGINGVGGCVVLGTELTVSPLSLGANIGRRTSEIGIALRLSDGSEIAGGYAISPTSQIVYDGAVVVSLRKFCKLNDDRVYSVSSLKRRANIVDSAFAVDVGMLTESACGLTESCGPTYFPIWSCRFAETLPFASNDPPPYSGFSARKPIHMSVFADTAFHYYWGRDYGLETSADLKFHRNVLHFVSPTNGLNDDGICDAGPCNSLTFDNESWDPHTNNVAPWDDSEFSFETVGSAAHSYNASSHPVEWHTCMNEGGGPCSLGPGMAVLCAGGGKPFPNESNEADKYLCAKVTATEDESSITINSRQFLGRKGSPEGSEWRLLHVRDVDPTDGTILNEWGPSDFRSDSDYLGTVPVRFRLIGDPVTYSHDVDIEFVRNDAASGCMKIVFHTADGSAEVAEPPATCP